MFRRIGVILAALALLIGLSACDLDAKPKAQDDELKSQQSGYEGLVDSQPAEAMTYSPTRNTIKAWAQTWNEPGKLAYVYLMNANGDTIGYYVLTGPPVSMCASLTPTYRFEQRDVGDFMGDVQVPAPSVDGVYYSGGQCNTYYGIDASTGAYVEYTVGTGLNVLLYDQPQPRQDAQPLGYTTVEDVS